MEELEVSFGRVEEGWCWEEISGCPGRYTMSPVKSVSFPVLELLRQAGMDLSEGEMSMKEKMRRWIPGSVVRDGLCVIRIREGCGIITYEHSRGSFLHTLNTASGFERKLKALGIFDCVFPSPATVLASTTQ